MTESLTNPAATPDALVLPDGATPSPMQLLHLAIVQGVPIETLERLQAMAEKAQDRQAATDFSLALARFQQDCPPIEKRRTTKDSASRNGGSSFGFMYANLDDIVRTIGPAAAANGLSWSFSTRQVDGGIVEDCTLRHVGGHSVTSSSPIMSLNSKLPISEQQKCGGAQTYGRRYALTGALGITTGDADDDETSGKQPDPFITPEQVEVIQMEIDKRQISISKMFEFLGVTHLTEIPASQFLRLMNDVKRKPLKAEAEKGAEWPEVTE